MIFSKTTVDLQYPFKVIIRLIKIEFNSNKIVSSEK